MRSAVNWKAYLQPRFGLKFLFSFMAASAVYISAYWALLDPMILVNVGHHGIVIEGSREPHYGSLALDGALNAFCRVVFAPIEQIDYLMRPEYWNKYSDLTDAQDIQNTMGGWSEVTRNSE
jgi:hypothetical protein